MSEFDCDENVTSEFEELNEMKDQVSDKIKKGVDDVKDQKPVNVKKEILSWVLYIGGVLLATFLIVHFVGQRTGVIGLSMYPTLDDGDNLLVDKISYRMHEPERFDIIVFPEPETGEKNYIKRIIGMPGETVQIIDGEVYINGDLLEEHYCQELMDYYGVAEEPLEIAEDEYFVLGDNRNNSKDSRVDVVGNIKREKIIGRAFWRVWPFSKFGKVE